MAKEEHKGEAEHLKGSGKREGESKEPKREEKGGKEEKGHSLHEIRTRFTKNGSAIHEHHYKDKHGVSMPEKPEYVSSDMDDLHQHMDDHAGPMMSQGEGGGEEQGGGQEEAAGGAGEEEDEGHTA